jgi:hypothetical protein
MNGIIQETRTGNSIAVLNAEIVDLEGFPAFSLSNGIPRALARSRGFYSTLNGIPVFGYPCEAKNNNKVRQHIHLPTAFLRLHLVVYLTSLIPLGACTSLIYKGFLGLTMTDWQVNYDRLAGEL